MFSNLFFLFFFLILFAAICLTTATKNNQKIPILNGYFIDRVAFTIFYDTPMIGLVKPLTEIKKIFESKPKEVRAQDGLFLRKAKGVLKLECINEKDNITNQTYSKFFLKLVENLSMQCFFNGNVWYCNKNKLYNKDSIHEYLFQFNMIPFKKGLGLPRDCWLKGSRKILYQQLEELKKEVKWHLNHYENEIISKFANNYSKVKLAKKKLMVTFGSVELCKDFRNSSAIYWRKVLDKVEAKWDMRNSTLTNYKRWWITKEEKQKIRETLNRNKFLSERDEELSEATGIEYKNHKEISAIDLKYGYDVNKYGKYLESDIDLESCMIEPPSEQKKNQIHFYHKMISQARVELQWNKDRTVNAVLNALIIGDISPEYCGDLLIDIMDTNLVAVNFDETLGNPIAKSKMDVINEISRNTKIDSYLILKILTAKGLEELTDYHDLDENGKAIIRKRNQKLRKAGFIEYDRVRQKYVHTGYLRFLRKQIKAIEKDTSDDVMCV